MARLDKFFYIGPERRVLLPQKEDSFKLVGVCYDRAGFEDGEIIETSLVRNIENDIAYTKSGSVYELGEKHPDLVDLENAIQEGYPVVQTWQIFEGLNGVSILAFTKDSYKRGIITAQEGNFIVLSEEIKAFVIWINAYPNVSSVNKGACLSKRL